MSVIHSHPYEFPPAPERFIPPSPLIEWPPVPEWQAREWSSWLNQRYGWNQQQISQYLQHDRYAYGFGVRRHVKEPWKWFYLPLPVQIPIHSLKVPNIMFGGAVGGTKSHSVRWDAIRNCWAIKEFKCILMRRTYKELKRNHMDLLRRETRRINYYFQDEVINFIPSEFECRFPLTDSLIILGHCQNSGDEEDYLSDEYDAFYPDEMATFLKDQVMGVSSRVRTTKPGILARMVGGTNPGGAHTLWCLDYFVNKSVSVEENPRYKPDKYHFVPARLYDNPYLMDPDGTFDTYIDRLFTRGESRRRQLLDGDWSVISGQFFSEFDASRHVSQIDIPRGTKFERWIDWGYSADKYGICLWVAILPSGRIYVFHEYKFNRTIASMVAENTVKETREILRTHKWSRISRSIADPAMFAPDGSSGEDFSETFSRYGVPIQEGDNSRVLGWGRVRHWFADAPDGYPWMIFDPSCRICVRTLPSLVSDPKDPEDVDTDGEDHAADAIRYGVMARPSPPRIIQFHRPELPADSIGRMVQDQLRKPVRVAGKVS